MFVQAGLAVFLALRSLFKSAFFIFHEVNFGRVSAFIFYTFAFFVLCHSIFFMLK